MTSALRAADIVIRPTTPVSHRNLLNLIDDEHRKGHFPDVWDPHKSQKPCLLSPPAVVTASPASGCSHGQRTSTCAQDAGVSVAVDRDHGPETRRAVTSFQMHNGIAADEIASAQTESKATQQYASDGRPPCHPVLTASVLFTEILESPLGPRWNLGGPAGEAASSSRRGSSLRWLATAEGWRKLSSCSDDGSLHPISPVPNRRRVSILARFAERNGTQVAARKSQGGSKT
jgi:peptidoglycan hydrolase-like protein with peptidoglycan-binding domain